MEAFASYDAKNRLSELCNQVAETGEPCVISRPGMPIVKLVPYEAAESTSSVWDLVDEAQAKYAALKEDFDLPPPH